MQKLEEQFCTMNETTLTPEPQDKKPEALKSMLMDTMHDFWFDNQTEWIRSAWVDLDLPHIEDVEKLIEKVVTKAQIHDEDMLRDMLWDLQKPLRDMLETLVNKLGLDFVLVPITNPKEDIENMVDEELEEKGNVNRDFGSRSSTQDLIYDELRNIHGTIAGMNQPVLECRLTETLKNILYALEQVVENTSKEEKKVENTSDDGTLKYFAKEEKKTETWGEKKRLEILRNQNDEMRKILLEGEIIIRLIACIETPEDLMKEEIEHVIEDGLDFLERMRTFTENKGKD